MSICQIIIAYVRHIAKAFIASGGTSLRKSLMEFDTAMRFRT